MLAPSPYRLRLATPDDMAAWRAHLAEHMRENGRNGAFFAPFSQEQVALRFTPERVADARTAAARPLDACDWLRVIVAEDESGRMIGHTDLHGGAIAAEMHRCRLGIGILAAHHRRGLGDALMKATIDWARAAGLAWMDLGVFGGNEPALALYRKLGFVEVGRVPDRFVVDGVSLTDIVMTLDLRAR
jgi:ribosomal protein S18 acetylase RimI-like enzyme